MCRESGWFGLLVVAHVVLRQETVTLTEILSRMFVCDFQCLSENVSAENTSGLVLKCKHSAQGFDTINTTSATCTILTNNTT